jgi:hypothetical protein
MEEHCIESEGPHRIVLLEKEKEEKEEEKENKKQMEMIYVEKKKTN